MIAIELAEQSDKKRLSTNLSCSYQSKLEEVQGGKFKTSHYFVL